jgi:hypothetical protein
MRVCRMLIVLLILGGVGSADEPNDPTSQVAQTKGLIAFWDFSLTRDGTWSSYRDEDAADRAYPVFLRRIGDPKAYKPNAWPYEDERSKLTVDRSGPFGGAVRFDQGHIFAEVPRKEFDETPLDVCGRRPFTLIAWAKFVGKRHLVAGIWDEGGWDKYGGRRQIALFGGLFGSKSVIGHISATGASSYPQSTISGSQYARCRAIDGQGFANDQWVCMAMTFDPARGEVVVYTNGVATATEITDPAARDVFRPGVPIASNPYGFPWSIYSPRSFVLKYNGYNVETSGVYEHWLEVDTGSGKLVYRRSCLDGAEVPSSFRVTFNVEREGKRLLPEPLVFAAVDDASVELPAKLVAGDRVVTSFHVLEGGEWQQVGSEIRYGIREGAPFTFGRALGLGDEPIDHGTHLFIDGVAVFDRELSGEELRALSFCGR